MMQDMAMQIMEIMMNSIHAKPSRIQLKISDSAKDNKISFTVQDNGSGMSEEMVKKITDPFVTTRTTRKIGMGVAFLKEMCEQCKGALNIRSSPGKGTEVEASVQKDCIDTPEMGDLGELMMECVQADETIEYSFTYSTDTGQFVFQTDEVRKQLADVSLLEPSVLLWIKEYINQGIQQAKEESK